MKFSVCLATGYEGLAYPIPFCKPRELITTAQFCEKLGYDAVWGNDHMTTQNYVRDLFPDTPPNFYEPLITLAMIAQATTTLRVGTALLVLPMREPVYLMKQVTAIDQLSGGRFMLGVGIGAYREEFEAWSGRRAKTSRRGNMMDEGLAALRTLMTDTTSSHDGEYYSFTNVQLFPKPLQRPFPLYIGGHNMAAVERAASLGQGWLPGWRPFHELEERIKQLKARAAELGREPSEIEIAPQFSLLIGKTVESAEKTYMASGLVAHRVSLAYTGRDPKHQVTANLVGAPDAIIEKIQLLRNMGVDHCAAMVVAVNSQQEYLDQIQWFSEEVMPHVG